MASYPPNPDTRDLPPGWIQQYNVDYRQWFYVNTREQPPRSSWQHPRDLFAPPPGPPPSDRSTSPYPPPPGYGGYQPTYGGASQGYYPPGQYAGGPSYAPQGYQQPNRGTYPAQQVVYEDQRKQKKGPGLGTAVLAGGAGLLGGALLMDAIEDHNEREQEIGYDQGYGQGYDQGYDDNGGGFF